MATGVPMASAVIATAMAVPTASGGTTVRGPASRRSVATIGMDGRDSGRRYDDRRVDNGNRFDNRQGWNDGRRFDNGGRWNAGWRRDDRYDWNRYRSYNRDAFRLPRYYAPYGWNDGYRRFSIGVVLSSGLWGQNYWIDDPWSYRLPEAYGPYGWVRYYNDALLVDLRSGIVVDTVYGIFYY